MKQNLKNLKYITRSQKQTVPNPILISVVETNFNGTCECVDNSYNRFGPKSLKISLNFILILCGSNSFYLKVFFFFLVFLSQLITCER